jgi:hypothetical protein
MQGGKKAAQIFDKRQTKKLLANTKLGNFLILKSCYCMRLNRWVLFAFSAPTSTT